VTFSKHFGTEPDEDGEIFIDPTHFKIILNHLRGTNVSKDIAAMLGYYNKQLYQPTLPQSTLIDGTV
jgi:hypothetical protein